MIIKTEICGEFHGVYRTRASKNPHFCISGCSREELDRSKVREYLEGCDWTDRGSPGWITPVLRPDDFLKD